MAAESWGPSNLGIGPGKDYFYLVSINIKKF